MHPTISSTCIQQLQSLHPGTPPCKSLQLQASRVTIATSTVQPNCVHQGCRKAGNVNTTLMYQLQVVCCEHWPACNWSRSTVYCWQQSSRWAFHTNREIQSLVFSAHREIGGTELHTHDDYHMPLGLRPLRHNYMHTTPTAEEILS